MMMKTAAMQLLRDAIRRDYRVLCDVAQHASTGLSAPSGWRSQKRPADAPATRIGTFVVTP
jgi:hypothetical protein